MNNSLLKGMGWLCVIFFCMAFKSEDEINAMKTKSLFFQLKNLAVEIKTRHYAEKGLSFLVLHDDENTGVQAAEAYLKENGGRITELCYGGGRNLGFKINTASYAFDPNSMFTDKGVLLNLKRYSPSKPGATAVAVARSLGLELLKTYLSVSDDQPIITLHNNTDGRFDVNSYLSGNYLFGTADSVYVNPEMDPDDMVFVTEAGHFSYLKHENVNVVLQSILAPNDGSLSVYAQLNQIPYINIEVQHGHVEENLRLIRLIGKMLRAEQQPPFVSRTAVMKI